MSNVTKSSGKYILEPDLALAARTSSKQDVASLQKELSEAALRGLLVRILLRLELLEQH